jgi:type II secretory ATPase GspE/PulE/Tfp pilus assembly ATPase PilB-like protein
MTNAPFRTLAPTQPPVSDALQEQQRPATKSLTWSGSKPSLFQPTDDVATLVARFAETLCPLFPVSVARIYQALPVKSPRGDGVLLFVTSRAHDETLKREFKFVLGSDVEFEYGSEEVVVEAIELAYNDSDKKLKDGVEAMREVDRAMPSLVLSTNEVQSKVDDPILKFINSLLYLACQRGASDIYITPLEQGIFIRYKIDGNILSNDLPISSLAIHERLVRRLKVLARLESHLVGVLADGEFTWSEGLYRCTIRLAVIPTVWGDRVTLRVHSSRARKLRLSELSLQEEILDEIYLFAGGRPGLGIIAGPTGSGKTTLLYSLIQHLRDQGKEILTIEDPVEVVLPGISQCAVQPNRGFTFADAIRSMLRHDPDVIMIGEVRDEESAGAMVRAALTGHFVLTTTHASDVFGVISRLLEFGIMESMIREALRLIVCQNLYPRLCNVCRTKHPNSGGWVANGCESCCFSGLSGRVPINELIAGDIRSTEGSGFSSRSSSAVNFISMQQSIERAHLRGNIRLSST